MTISLFFCKKYSISTVIGGYTGWSRHCRCEVRTDRDFNKAKFFIIPRSLVSLLTEATAADYKSPKHTYLLKTKTVTLLDTNHRSELSHWRSLWCKRSKKWNTCSFYNITAAQNLLVLHNSVMKLFCLILFDFVFCGFSGYSHIFISHFGLRM